MPADVEKDPKQSVHYVEPPATAVPSYLPQKQATELASYPPSLAGTDEEYEDDDYDWSGEEDLVDEEAKFEHRMGVKRERKGWGFKRIMILLFSSLIGSTFLAGLLVTPALLIHFYWYKPNPTERRHYINQNIQAWLFWAAVNFLLSWYLAVAVNIVPSIFRFFISIVWGRVSERIKTRIELYNSVKDTFKPVLYAACCWASWAIIFGQIYHLYNLDEPEASRADYTPRTYQAVQFLFFLALMVCIQRMLSHAVAFAFHQTAFKERIETLQTALVAVDKLKDYRPKHYNPRGARSGARTPVPILGTVGHALGLGHITPNTEKENFSFLTSALKKHSQHTTAGTDGGDEAETVVGSPSRGNTLNTFGFGVGGEKTRHSWFNAQPSPADRFGRSPQDTSNANSSPADGTPFRSAPPDRFDSHIDSPHRYPPTTSSGSPRPSVDLAGDTIVSAARALKNAVLHDARNIKGAENETGLLGSSNAVATAAEAKHLARSIWMRFRERHSHRNYLIASDFYPAFPTHEEAEAAFRVFDKDNNGDISRAEIKTSLMKVYKERRFLARSMRDVSKALKTLDRILLFFAMVILFFISLSVFGVEVGNSLTSVYSIGIAASFIFKNAASSAFDAIMFLFVTHPFDTGDRCFIDQEVLIVKQMGLFATVFTRADGSETYYFNSQLFNKFITNIRRSDKTFENLTMHVAWRTPLEKLDALEKCINDWLSTEENRWFQPNTSIVLQHIHEQKYLELTIGIGHNGNWQDWALRNARRTAFHAAVQYYARQLGIVGYEAPIPIVYGDPETRTYNMVADAEPSILASTLGDDVPTSPLSPSGLGEGDAENTEQMKPTLGFLPPPAIRSAHLRSRKSKGRKAILRGMDG